MDLADPGAAYCTGEGRIRDIGDGQCVNIACEPCLATLAPKIYCGGIIRITGRDNWSGVIGKAEGELGIVKCR